MNVISTSTFFFKKAFPILWVGIIVVVSGSAVAAGALSKAPFFLIGPVFMLVVGYFVFRKFVWDLADEVKDGGDFLVVRRGDIEDRVQLSNVMNVSMTQFTNPPRLTLRLRTPGKFGDEIVFIPKLPALRINRFARNEIAEDLIKRIDRARQESR
ncbi:MAG TPA: hypothetical protein VGH80_11495 [Xanthomonadaceae bacterium]|jgi:hypothetical protein